MSWPDAAVAMTVVVCICVAWCALIWGLPHGSGAPKHEPVATDGDEDGAT